MVLGYKRRRDINDVDVMEFRVYLFLILIVELQGNWYLWRFLENIDQ